uniref:Uncharacterized protein n=1 Tax=Janibacter limosus TaxID=53458 RepID=A0AC61U4C1_9MICO|nr:hypothetical protein [Janibacter limosus]
MRPPHARRRRHRPRRRRRPPGVRRRPRPASLGRVIGAHPEAEIAVARSPVGTKGAVRVVGDAQPLVARSTIKVPLALAVVRAGHGQQMGPDIDRALTASDNEAAGRLWADLGGGHRAATAVEVQLERGRDRRTGVPPRVTVPGYSPFGQSTRRLTDQTRFTAALPCLAGSTSITQAMGRVADGQRWGLGGIDGARYKGGWGPTPGGYVVRQLGIVTGAKGATAVTLQVRAGNHRGGHRGGGRARGGAAQPPRRPADRALPLTPERRGRARPRGPARPVAGSGSQSA